MKGEISSVKVMEGFFYGTILFGGLGTGKYQTFAGVKV